MFESGQNPIIVGQGAYNSAYGTTFQNNGPEAGLVQIYDTSLTFGGDTGYGQSDTLTINLKPQDDPGRDGRGL